MKCRDCPCEAVEGRARCEQCLLRARLEAQARHHDRAREGQCTRCVRRAVPETTLCAYHTAQNRAKAIGPK